MLSVAIRQILADGSEQYYRAYVPVSFAERHNNYALVSLGWTVGGPDADLPLRAFQYLQRRGRLTEITREQWNHSGCQSSCMLRGAKQCRW